MAVTTNRGAKVCNEASRQQVVDVNQEPLVHHLVVCHQQDHPLAFAAGLQNSAPVIRVTQQPASTNDGKFRTTG